MIDRFNQINIIKLLFFSLYLFFTIIFLYLFFRYEIYAYIKADFFWSPEYNSVKNYIKDNFILSSFLFFIFSFFWVFFLGFGSPISILAGMLFGVKYGFILLIFSSVSGVGNKLATRIIEA